MNLRVPDHVRHHSEDHGAVVILDTTGGKWLALNATAGDFWRAWEVGCGFEAGVRAVAARYPRMPLEALLADGQRLMDELIHRGLLTTDAPPAPRPPSTLPEMPGNGTGAARGATGPVGSASRPVDAPSGLAHGTAATAGGTALMAETAAPAELPRLGWGRGGLALCFLIATCLIVRCFSFRIQLALVRATRRWCRRGAGSDEAAATVATVDWAARRYPGRAACLEQSLTAVLLAAAARRRLDWCLGAAPDPYRFHAWVEAHGRPVPTQGDPATPLGYARLLSA
jgi:transglutaminase superfamily protein/coenzyme PQQ synthesis protein D (PqqD)